MAVRETLGRDFAVLVHRSARRGRRRPRGGGRMPGPRMCAALDRKPDAGETRRAADDPEVRWREQFGRRRISIWERWRAGSACRRDYILINATSVGLGAGRSGAHRSRTPAAPGRSLRHDLQSAPHRPPRPGGSPRRARSQRTGHARAPRARNHWRSGPASLPPRTAPLMLEAARAALGSPKTLIRMSLGLRRARRLPADIRCRGVRDRRVHRKPAQRGHLPPARRENRSCGRPPIAPAASRSPGATTCPSSHGSSCGAARDAAAGRFQSAIRWLNG